MYLGHLVEVVVGDGNILGVAGHVDNLERAKVQSGAYSPPTRMGRDRGHQLCYLAVLLPEGGREELDWEMGLYQPRGWGVLQLLNSCGTGDLEV